jgi:hypothetical protein
MKSTIYQITYTKAGNLVDRETWTPAGNAVGNAISHNIIARIGDTFILGHSWRFKDRFMVIIQEKLK